MRVEHPRAGDGPGVPPTHVDVNGTSVAVTADGTFDVPDDAAGWLRAFATAHGLNPDSLIYESGTTQGTCQTVKNDGEVCGRDLPCPYHTDTETDEE